MENVEISKSSPVLVENIEISKSSNMQQFMSFCLKFQTDVFVVTYEHKREDTSL